MREQLLRERYNDAVPRIVLATFGSFGDLHPYMALGLALQSRGHEAVIATHELYRHKVERAGLLFRPLRPDYDPGDRAQNFMAMDAWRGGEVILRRGLFPHLRETYADLERAVEGADLLISHMIVFAAPLLAEKTGIRWATVLLFPLSLFSAMDPSYVTPSRLLDRMMNATPALTGFAQGLLRSHTVLWCEPIFALRRELGLSPAAHPLFEGQHSPDLALVVFSRAFAAPQPDWPQQAKQTGFLFFDSQKGLDPGLEEFLENGSRPVVFTLGTAAVINPGRFFEESKEAIRRMGIRAVLLTGPNRAIQGTPDVWVTAYAPFRELFPRAAAVVHQGGIGTTAQTLRAGVPSLVVPFAHDQFDNAARLERLVVGRAITRRGYRAQEVVEELACLFGDPSYAVNALRLGEQIRAEQPEKAACDAIEELLNGKAGGSSPSSGEVL